jgi:hypothetical protein
MNPAKIFLWVCAAGLVPIALSYGVMPVQSLHMLLGLTVETVNEMHIFRAIMGLYLGMVLLWIIGAMHEKYERAAIVAVVLFMGGLAAGRTLSIVADGWPHWVLVSYTAIEVVIAIVGIVLLRRQ